MPDKVWFVTGCDPKKYNIGPEQEWFWFDTKEGALAKVGELTEAGYEHVSRHLYAKVAIS